MSEDPSWQYENEPSTEQVATGHQTGTPEPATGPTRIAKCYACGQPMHPTDLIDRLREEIAALREQLAQKRPFSDALADKVIAGQVAEIDHLSDEVKELRKELSDAQEQLHGKRLPNGGRINTRICLADSDGNEIWNGHVDKLRDKLNRADSAERELAQAKHALAQYAATIERQGLKAAMVVERCAKVCDRENFPMLAKIIRTTLTDAGIREELEALRERAAKK